MGDSSVPFRWVAILTGLMVLLAFALGYFNWNDAPYSCFNGRGHYGPWVVVGSIGHFEVRVKAWGCPDSERYDPKQWQKLQNVKNPP